MALHHNSMHRCTQQTETLQTSILVPSAPYFLKGTCPSVTSVIDASVLYCRKQYRVRILWTLLRLSELQPHSIQNGKKRSEETQTLRAGGAKKFRSPQTPSRGRGTAKI